MMSWRRGLVVSCPPAMGREIESCQGIGIWDDVNVAHAGSSNIVLSNNISSNNVWSK
jgi:hypothetical protein